MGADDGCSKNRDSSDFYIPKTGRRKFYIALIFVCGISVYSQSALVAEPREETVEVGPSLAVNPLIMGINNNVKQAMTYSRLRDMYLLVRPPLLRYPGGTWSSCWDWKAQTIFPKDHIERKMRKSPVWLRWIMPAKTWFDQSKSRALTSIEWYGDLAKELDAEVAWIPNFNSDSIENCVEMVDTIVKKGYEVKYLELGNEYNGRSFNKRFPTVESYLKEAQHLAAKLKEKHPNLKLGYASNVPNSSGIDADETERSVGKEMASREHHWDEAIARTKDDVAIVDHHYVGFIDYKGAEYIDEFDALPLMKQMDFWLQSPHFMVRNSLDYVSRHESTHSKKLWISEYNMQVNGGSGKRYVDTMINALYLSAWQALMLVEPRFELALLHSLSGHRFGFISQQGSVLTVTPAVQLYTHMLSLTHRYQQVRSVQVLGAPRMQGVMHWEGQDCSSLVALEFTNPTHDEVKRALVVLNLGRDSFEIRLGSLYSSHDGGYALVADDPSQAMRVPLDKKSDEMIPSLRAPLALEVPLAPQKHRGSVPVLAPRSFNVFYGDP